MKNISKKSVSIRIGNRAFSIEFSKSFSVYKRYYEQIDGKNTDITGEIPFDLPQGWTWCRLKEFGNILYGVSESAKQKGRYKLLRITDIQNDRVNWQTVPYTDFSEDATTYFLRDGDIVFARTGATVGKSFLIDSAPANAIYASYLIRVRFIFPSLAKFTKHFFGSSDYWNQIIAKSVGTGQPNVNGTSLSELLLPLPPLAEQKRIVVQIESLLKCVDEIDRESETLEKSITLAKQKILDLAIRGKLVPQDPKDEPASELLKKIKTEKESLIKAGKLKRDKHESFIFRGDDNCYYWKIGEKTVDITGEIPFEIPGNWAWTRLAVIIDLLSGRDLTAQKYQSEKAAFPYITGACNFDEGSLIINRWTDFPEVISKTNDVLVTCKGTIGEIAVNSAGCVHIARQIMALRPSLAIDHDYLAIILQSLMSQIKSEANGLIPGISRDVILNLLMPLPPLTEQHRIVHNSKRIDFILKSLQE